MPPRLRRLTRPLAWAGAGLALALVFAAYLQPAFVFSIANQLWSCF